MRQLDEPVNSRAKRPNVKAFFQIGVRRRSFLRKGKILADPVRRLTIEVELVYRVLGAMAYEGRG